MTNLIFDLSNIAHRSIFVVGGYGSKSFTFDSQSELDQLMRKLAMDVTYIVRLVNPSRIIFALDSKSWRKTINIDENEGYKANRVKSSHINWNNVYNAIDEFTEIMKDNGIIITKIDNAEADDIIYLWSKELVENQKQHVIIVSGDEDMRQLVSKKDNNGKPVFCTVFNPFMQGKKSHRTLYVPNEFESWINEAQAVDIFNLKGSVDVDKEDFNKVVNYEKTELEVVDGNMVALRKIFCGDDGDNVPAIYSWLKKDKNGEDKQERITNSKFEKIYEEIKEYPDEKLTHKDLVKRAEKVYNAIKKVSKQDIKFDYWTRLNRQIKLVVLDSDFFPPEIVKTFEEIKKEDLDKPRVQLSNVNMRDLLEGTRYVTAKKTSSEASIFKQIDRIQGKALF